MASGEFWNNKKMFELYLYDYLVKHKMPKTAALFKKEANVNLPDRLAINDSPRGLFYEWWSMFFDVFLSKHSESQEDKEEAFLQAMQVAMAKQLLKDHTVVPRIVTQSAETFPSANGFDNMQFFLPSDATNFNEIDHDLGQSDMEYFEPNLLPVDISQPNLLYSVPTTPSHHLPPMLEEAQQENGITLGMVPSLMDPMLNGFQSERFSSIGSPDAGASQGVSPVPQNGWPVNVPNGTQQFQVRAAECHEQPLSPQLQPCTPGRVTSGPGTRTPTHFNSSDPTLTMSETKGMDQLMTVPLTSTGVQQNQCKQPHWKQLTIDRGRNKEELRTSRSPADPMEDGFEVEKVDSLVSLDGNNAEVPNNRLSELKGDCTGSAKHEHKGYSLKEVIGQTSSKNELLCCDFSSEGSLLSSAGVERKVFVWNVVTHRLSNSSERHRDTITDIRFQHGSETVATSSLDQTIKIWDATKPKKSRFCLQGHGEQVMSLDFHPRNSNLLCSCDFDGEIKFWDLADSPSCIHTFKGAKKQVRFQPQYGKLLATASDDVVSLFDVETKTSQLSFKGHAKDVLSVCWDNSGKYVLSVSEDRARLWSVMSGGKCIRELHATRKRFHSCTFHPINDHLWIIGGLQFMELWDAKRDVAMSIPAHNGLVGALAQSSPTSMVASVGHDRAVKLWQ